MAVADYPLMESARTSIPEQLRAVIAEAVRRQEAYGLDVLVLGGSGGRRPHWTPL